jgi:endonuclease-3
MDEQWVPCSAQRRAAIVRHLKAEYPNPGSELHFSNEYELVVAVLLSAQCTDKKVNQVTPELFSMYPGFEDLAGAAVPALEDILRPINYYKTKSKHLKGLGERVTEVFLGRLPRTLDELVSLPGVGRKTANVVLSELGVVPTFPVDTHVFRLSHRLGFSLGSNPDAVEGDLKRLFKKELWRSLHHWLILHGRRVCIAQRPKCGDCRIRGLCRYYSSNQN